MSKKKDILLSTEDRKKLEELQKRAEIEDKVKTAILKNLAEFMTDNRDDWVYFRGWLSKAETKKSFNDFVKPLKEKAAAEKEEQKRKAEEKKKEKEAAAKEQKAEIKPQEKTETKAEIKAEAKLQEKIVKPQEKPPVVKPEDVKKP